MLASSRCRWVGCMAVLLAGGLASGCASLDVGQLQGAIRLDPASPEVLDYLNAHPAQPGEGVVAKDTSAPALQATGSYTVAGATTAPEIAQYSLNPSVEPGGSTFSVAVEPVTFQNQATYRFGSSDPSSPAARLSPAVLPLADDPDGTTFDVVECGAVVDVTVRLTGPEADLDALDPLAVCTVAASVRENPAGPTFVPQASSEPVGATVATLRNEGVTIPILVRAGQQAQLAAGCALSTSQSGFPENPAIQNPSLPGIELFFGGVAPAAAAIPCPAGLAIDLEIPVERSAGVLRGLLDVVGHSESRLLVNLAPTGFSLDTTLAQPNTPPHEWQFDGVPDGEHEVRARAVLDDGGSVLDYPRLAGPESVDVSQGQVTDLGSRFVVIPFTLRGAVTLRDPLPGSRLEGIVTAPFGGVSNTSLNATSHLRANGDPNFFFDAQGERGARGLDGRSFGRLQGAFDATTGRAELDGALLLVGLSPADGDVDGGDTLPANWSVPSFNIRLAESDFRETITLDRNDTGLFAALPGQEATLAPVDVCFGEYALRLETTDDFSLFAPAVSIASSAQEQLEDENGAFLRYDRVSGNAQSAPFTADAAADTVEAAIALPAFMSYELAPSVTIVSATTGNQTALQLATQTAPDDGPFECGDRVDPCARVDDTGIVSTLDVRIVSPAVSCSPDDVQLELEAVSTGGDLLSVEVVVDDQPPIPVCGGAQPCANPLEAEVPLGVQEPGTHVVEVRATGSTCGRASATRLVAVTERPVLVCPQPIVTQVRPSETAVPFDRLEARLQSSWSGGCADSLLPPVEDDHPASFPLGTTTVRFSTAPNDTAAGEQACETTVAVFPPDSCDTFESLPAGPVTGPFTLGGVEYRNPQNASVVDFFPPGQGNDRNELQIGKIEAELPFDAPWIRLRYVRGSGQPLRLTGLDEAGNVVQTWVGPTDNPEHQPRFCAVPGPPRRTLRLEGTEIMLLELCYRMTPPPGPPPGSLVIDPAFDDCD